MIFIHSENIKNILYILRAEKKTTNNYTKNVNMNLQ